ncbi:MAG: transcription termination/antitermination NusG family protein [Ardenticatenia bacterium]|nr:transcription termination/antitermination NusG family protein [Ardenticatenia bacterium]
MSWYTVHTKPNAEYRVARLLQEKGIEVFFPEIRSWRPRRGYLTEPLFPGYLFVRADWSDVPLTVVVWTPGVHRVVGFGGQPAVVPDETIGAIRERLEELEAQGGLRPYRLQPGERVRFVAGPFQGLEAVFDGYLRASDRVRVLLEFLGQVHQADVPVTHVTPIANTPPCASRPPRRTRGKGRWIRGRQQPQKRESPVSHDRYRRK